MPDKDAIEAEPMHQREITLADGRYMIFYTFGKSVADGRTLDSSDVDTLSGAAPPADAGGTDSSAAK